MRTKCASYEKNANTDRYKGSGKALIEAHSGEKNLYIACKSLFSGKMIRDARHRTGLTRTGCLGCQNLLKASGRAV